MAEALIALGGNVGDVRADARSRDRDALRRRRVRLMARSSDYRPRPGASRTSRRSSICCASVETELTPHALLARAQAVERAFGRDRAHERRWGPRTLDIDLIAYDDVDARTTPT